MKKLIIAFLFFVACGSGSDGDMTEAPEQLTCVKDNVQYILVDGEWKPWKNVEVLEPALDEEGRFVGWMLRDAGTGVIQIIADCGANVNVNISADESASDTDIGSNNDNTTN